MGKKIRVIIAVAIIIGVSFWCIDRIMTRNYQGARIAFDVGNGSVVITNPGQNPILTEMRSSGRTANFRIESPENNLRESSTRQGTRSNAYHAIQLELPSGQSTINITSGSNVRFLSPSDQRISAVVTPLNSESMRLTIIATLIIIVAALFYISRLYDHQWITSLRTRIADRKQKPESAPT